MSTDLGGARKGPGNAAPTGEWLRVKNWRQFQHYKDRNPPWIKLHFSMLSSVDWVTLDDPSRVLAIACMLVASRHDGAVPADPEYIRRVAYLKETPNFRPLIACGFLVEGRDCKQVQALARPETETEAEKEKEETLLGKPNGVALKADAKEILNFLNAKSGKAFQPTDTNLDFIVGRFREGYTKKECRQVIAKKVREWSGDEKMRGFLRPSTLFNREKFNQYAGELVVRSEEPANG